MSVIVSPTAARTRSAHKLRATFESLLPDDFLRLIANFVNSRIAKPVRGFRARDFSLEELKAIVRMMIERMGLVGVLLDDYLLSSTRLGRFGPGKHDFVHRKRYYLFISLFDMDAELAQALFEMLSRAFRATFNFLDHKDNKVVFAADESGLPYCGRHPWRRFIPRKPNPDCILVYMMACTLQGSGRPVVYFMLPDAFDHDKRLPHKVSHVTSQVDPPLRY